MVTPLRIADTGSPGSNLFLILCLNFIIFYWRIIALQCFVSFFCTTIYGISYTCTYIPSLLYLPPTSRPANPSRSSQSNRAELPPAIQQLPTSCLFYTWYCLHMGFPDHSAGKQSACKAGDPGSIPGLLRSPEEGIGYPLQYSWQSCGHC